MRTYFTLLLFSLACSLRAQTLYYPPLTGNTWQTLSLASQNFCPDRVDSLYKFLEDNHTKGFILLKDGKIVLEKYFDAFVQDSIWYWASAGKSLTAFLVGQAQEEALIDIDDPTSEYLGVGWTTAPPDKEAKITIWHQLTMTNGLDDTFIPTPSQPDPNLCKDPECLTYLADAGTRWAYHTGPYRLLHNVLAAACGQTIQQFTKSRILDPTGMKGLWFQDVFYSRPRDMARFGLLCLGKGVWNGDTLLRDQAYFNNMINTAQPLNKSYGYLWWLNGKPSFMLPGLQLVIPGKLIANAPDDLYAALGKNDQKIHIVPSKGWVVVRMGNASGYVGPGGDAVPIFFDNDMWAYLNALECNTIANTEPASDPVQVSPNPSAHVWEVSAPTPAERLEIWDIQGRLIQTQSPVTASACRVELPTAPPGIYLGKWISGGNVFSFRLVKN